MATTTNFGWETPDDTDLVKDGAAAMRTLGQSIDTSFVDLKGGTSGQMLTKASNTDLDYTWVTPQIGDITSITATSPLTGGGTAGDVTVGIQAGSTTQSGALQLTDSTSSTSTTTAATPNSVKTSYDLANAAIPKSTVTTAGDVIYATGSGAVTRLGIGTAGQVLTVNGGATAPSWATPSSGGGLTLLSTTTLTGSSVIISSISGSYKNLQLIVKDVYASSVGDINMRLNGDTGANYSFARIRVNGTTVAGGNAGGGTFMQIAAPSTTNSTAIERSFAVVYLPRYTDTDQQEITSTSFSYWSSLPTYYSASGNYNKSAAITSITILAEAGTFSGGTAYLYGES